jgi:cytidine deaminase
VTDAASFRDASLRSLHEAAVAVSERAHCPYSEYPVGAALRTTRGEVFVGANVENAAFPEGWCAETSAIASMVASTAGPDDRRIEAIVTVTGGETPGTPCGGCRQRIREFAGPDTVVHATTVGGVVHTFRIDEILPDSFGPERLT